MEFFEMEKIAYFLLLWQLVSFTESLAVIS